jgi:hypothetical protein
MTTTRIFLAGGAIGLAFVACIGRDMYLMGVALTLAILAQEP